MAEESRAPKRDLATVIGPPEGASQPTIMVTTEPKTRFRSTKELVDARLSVIEESKAFTVLERRQVELACGVDAVELDLRSGPERIGRESFMTMLFVVHEGTAYELSLLDPGRTEPGCTPGSRAALRSFEPGRPLAWPKA